jgi:cation:H+ antiporter
MALWIPICIVALTAIIVLISAEFAVKYSIKLARHLRLSDELIGMTVLAIGTSIPEIMTHIMGSVEILKDPSLLNPISGLVIGTNIGSDVFQQNFLIGLVALLGVVVIARKHLLKDVGGLVGAALIVLIFSFNGMFSRIEGVILVVGYFAYLYFLRKKGMLAEKPFELNNKYNNHIYKYIAILVLSFIAMAFAADFLLKNSTVLVKALPISASFFGVILLGIATAFPELITSLLAIRKKRARISAGILIGSNITNPMFALGLGAIISTYTVPKVIFTYDLPFKIATALLILLFLWKGKLKKRYAVILIGLYVLYLIFRNIYFPADVYM